MLTTLAIINMAVAAVLINDSIDEQNTQEPVEVVAVVDTETTSTDTLTAAANSDK